MTRETTNTVEVVARAVYSSFGEGDPDDWEMLPDETRFYSWENAIPQALAAIKAHTAALMEPSEEMLRSGGGVLTFVLDNMYEGTPRDAALDVLQAMLSAQEKTDTPSET